MTRLCALVGRYIGLERLEVSEPFLRCFTTRAALVRVFF